jgi:hypothetical protein
MKNVQCAGHTPRTSNAITPRPGVPISRCPRRGADRPAHRPHRRRIGDSVRSSRSIRRGRRKRRVGARVQ